MTSYMSIKSSVVSNTLPPHMNPMVCKCQDCAVVYYQLLPHMLLIERCVRSWRKSVTWGSGSLVISVVGLWPRGTRVRRY